MFFTVGMGPVEALVSGQAAGPMAVTMLGGLLLIVDVALLVVVVALAHTFSEGRSIGLTVTTGVATLATASAAAIHLVWVNLASNLEVEVPAQTTHFATWLAVNVWLLPLFGLLVGATLAALALALRASTFRFARRLGTASAVLGGLLVALAPFSGFAPDQSALVAVAVITLATVGISVLLVVALVRLALLLRGSGHLARPARDAVGA
ncbi:MAG TPA: hypothetical protein GXZ45_03720 [Propionibacterium sp.]|nr:hypothetical protein [Propionibacterium sp.]